jgi:hypothetical protein
MKTEESVKTNGNDDDKECTERKIIMDKLTQTYY